MNKDILNEDVATEGMSDSTGDTQEASDPVAEAIVKSHVVASMALGLVPVPLFDIAALTATQMSLLKELCEHYEVPFENFNLKSILISLVGGSLPIMSVVGFSSLIKVIPGFGSVAGMASLSITAGSISYSVGKVFIKHFESGGTFDDFDPKQAKKLLKSEFDYGKSVVTSFKDEEGEPQSGSKTPKDSA